MKQKKRILFVIESLYLGGGSERSLLALKNEHKINTETVKKFDEMIEELLAES